MGRPLLLIILMLAAAGVRADDCRILEELHPSRKATPDWLNDAGAPLRLFSLNRNCFLPIVAPHLYVDSHHRRETRECFGYQKTLAGSLEMYLLDRCSEDSSMGWRQQKAAVVLFRPGAIEELQRAGYIQPGSVPVRAPDHAFLWTTFGNNLFCLKHGQIQADLEKSPRAQLEAEGVTDARVLSWASTKPMRKRNTERRYEGLFHCAECMLGLFTAPLMLLFIWLFRSPIGFANFCACFFFVPMAMVFVPFSTVFLVLPVGIKLFALYRGARAPAARAPAMPRQTAKERPLPRAQLLPGAPDAGTCPYCSTQDPADDWVKCPTCDTPHHARCWKLGGGCTIFGCAANARDRQQDPKKL